MEPDDALRSRRRTAPHQLADAGGSRRVEPPAPHIDVSPARAVVRPAALLTRGSSYNADDSLAGFDVLYHNRMVEAAHQQARRDMATQTEESIVIPELGEAFRDGGGFRATPASAAAVARLAKRRYDGVHGSSGDGSSAGSTGGDAAAVGCAICIEDFEIGDDMSIMPCSHGFHEGCIAKWLARSRLCPCCRYALPASGV
jgi:hypothetical protein